MRTPTYKVASNPIRLELGELTVLFAGESQTRPGHRIGPKVVDYYLLHHVISGKGTYRADDETFRLGAGATFLIRPGQLFSYVADEDEPWRYRWIAFAGTRAEALVTEAGLRVVPVADTGGDRLPAEACRGIYDAFRSRRRSAALEAEGRLLLLLSRLQEASPGEEAAPPRPDSHGEELVRRVIDYLTAQYAEPVTIEGVAEALGYNRAYLSRVFKRHAGLSPVTFLTKLRVDRGRRLLRERPELTVEQIASSAGFRDALYFSKLFRRTYGESPTEYRAKVGRLTK